MARFVLILLIAVICAVLLLAARATGDTNTLPGSALPMPGFAEGWQAVNSVRLYDKENIYEHIDGEAELYFPYGLSRAAAVTYASTTDSKQTLSAEVYQMASPLDAFGIYSNYRYADALPASVGAEGYAEALQLMFCQDRYFVRINVVGDKNAVGKPMRSCAEAIAKSLPAARGRPRELRLVQIDGVIPRSEQYEAESVLGYDFFPRGLTAQAGDKESPVRVFVVITESAGAATQAQAKYVAYLTEKAAKFEQKDSRMRVQDPLHKDLVLEQTGRFLVGIANVNDADQAETLLNRHKKAARKAK